MKYASLFHKWRKERYFYFMPELKMKKIDDLDTFNVQLYTQLYIPDPESQNIYPTQHRCTDQWTYETVALTALVNPQIDLSEQTFYLQQFYGKQDLYNIPEPWNEANHGQIFKEYQTTNDMLWGWDATESSASKEEITT